MDGLLYFVRYLKNQIQSVMIIHLELEPGKIVEIQSDYLPAKHDSITYECMHYFVHGRKFIPEGDPIIYKPILILHD